MTSGVRLLVVRHGATALTNRVFNGCGAHAADPPLSPLGRAQAHWARDRLVALGPPTMHLISPALRARQTAEVMGYQPTHAGEPAVAEVDFGRWEGSSVAQARAADPEYFARWWSDPELPAPGGSSLAASAVEVRALVERLLLAADAADVLVVGHASTVRLLTALALRLPLTESTRVQVPPGAVAEVRFWSDGGSCLESMDWPRP